MTRAILTILLSTCVAGQAAALSCLAVSVPRSYQAAAASESQYVVALGQVDLLPGEVAPEPDPEGDPNAREGYVLEAQFTGFLGGPEGFERTAVFPVTVEVRCAAAWCGSVPVERTLAFVEQRDGTNVIVADPCASFAMDASEANVAAAEACLAGGDCAEEVR